jgi:hypothetical protein
MFSGFYELFTACREPEEVSRAHHFNFVEAGQAAALSQYERCHLRRVIVAHRISRGKHASRPAAAPRVPCRRAYFQKVV